MERQIVILSEDEAARTCGVQPLRFSRMIRKHGIPVVLLPNGDRVFIEHELLDWVKRYNRPEGLGVNHA